MSDHDNPYQAPESRLTAYDWWIPPALHPLKWIVIWMIFVFCAYYSFNETQRILTAKVDYQLNYLDSYLPSLRYVVLIGPCALMLGSFLLLLQKRKAMNCFLVGLFFPTATGLYVDIRAFDPWAVGILGIVLFTRYLMRRWDLR